MPLLPPRTPEQFNFTSPEIALKHIEILHRHNSIVTCLDAVVEAVKLFPDLGVSFLVLAYRILQNIQDRSRYNLYQARIFDFNIQPGDKVLDIGSGHNPFPKATHLADISLSNNIIGRDGVPFRYVDGKPVYECSVEKTPFSDKEFDFVYCSHVLEHAEHPALACQELIRIAKRGYIESPTKGKDIFLASARTSNHISYVELIGNVLTFFRYSNWEIEGIGYNILQQMHGAPQTDREKAFSALIYLYPRQINTMMLWEESFLFSSS